MHWVKNLAIIFINKFNHKYKLSKKKLIYKNKYKINIKMNNNHIKIALYIRISPNLFEYIYFYCILVYI